MRLTLALLCLTYAGLVGAEHNGQRQLTADRTQQFEADSLNCQIGSQHDQEYASEDIDFFYWYAMGTHQTIDPLEMFQLETLLFNAVKDDMLWCWEEKEILDRSRRLSTQQVKRKEKFTSQSRRLGITSFTIGKMDTETQCE